MDNGALGLIETKGLVSAIEAADAAAKAAKVTLIGITKTNPALMTVQVTGETAAVRSAIDAAKAAAERVGTVVSTHIIPRPSSDVVRMQGVSSGDGTADPSAAGSAGRKRQAKATPAKSAKAAPPGNRRAARSSKTATRAATLASPPVKRASDLESMTVRDLRALARSTPGLSIQGREIARANKAELLRALGR